MKMIAARYSFGVGVVVSCLALGAARAQLVNPILVGTLVPIVDEYGTNLKGSSATQTGDLVQIYRITSGFIEAPNLDGSPQANNVPIPGGTGFIGQQVASHLPDSGMFTIRISSNQPPAGARLFVRVFNQETIEQSSFYGDSAEFTIGSSQTDYPVLIPSAAIPLDDTDHSGIGLHNSWVKSLGPNPDTTDSDGDGLTNFEEWLAGTNPYDANSVLRIEHFIPTATGEKDIVWQSVAGRCYIIEFADDLMLGTDSFDPLHDVPFMADGPISTMTMDTVDFGLFRVRLADCPE